MKFNLTLISLYLYLQAHSSQYVVLSCSTFPLSQLSVSDQSLNRA